MELTDKTIQLLIRLAKRETCDDDLEEGEYYDPSDSGNFDDAWQAGYDDGETYIARLVLDDLEVNYNDWSLFWNPWIW